MKFRNKTKCRVIFLKPLGDKNWQKFDEKKFNPEENSISYEDKTFPLTSECYTYIDGKTTYIFADYEKEKIITFHAKDLGIDSKFLDKMLTTGKTGIIGQLMDTIKADMKEKKTDWGTLGKPIVIFVLGAVIGFFVGGGSI